MSLKGDILNILETKNLKKTAARIAVLKVFKDNSHALSYADLEKELKHAFDKSTVYRTLSSFEKHGLLHRVEGVSGIIKYALEEQHTSTHAHFVCNECDKTYCIETTQHKVDFNIPNGFVAEDQLFLVKGLCKECV